MVMKTTIEPGSFPPFIISERELKIVHMESGAPRDSPVTLEVMAEYPSVAVITSGDRRGTTDGSPNYQKFFCYSFDGSHVVTTYQVYTFTDKVDVFRDGLSADVEMEHYDITDDVQEDRSNNSRLIERHLERIEGRDVLIGDELRDKAREAYLEILWGVPSYHCIYQGSVPELPSKEEGGE